MTDLPSRIGAIGSPGPDVVRAVALIGVVMMNYHGYLMFRDGSFPAEDRVIDRFFDPFEGPLSTRFASSSS